MGVRTRTDRLPPGWAADRALPGLVLAGLLLTVVAGAATAAPTTPDTRALTAAEADQALERD